MLYVTDLRDLEGIELSPDAPGPALKFAHYLKRAVRAATASAERGPRPTALPCRRRPERRPCPGRLVVELQDLPSGVSWHCPACGEEGWIDGWQGSLSDLSGVARPTELDDLKRVVVPEEHYDMLLDLLSIDQRCERFIYAARPKPGGAELTGAEDDFEELGNAVAFEANHARTKKTRSRWDDVHDSLEGNDVRDRREAKPRPWLEQSADVVIDELASFGLVASRPLVAKLLRRQLHDVASALGIGEGAARRYLGDESLRQLARQAAVELAAEQPGADLFGQPRNVPLPLPALGRVVTAIAESAQVRVANNDSVGAHGSLQLLSLIGSLLHELPASPSGTVLLPQAALARGARLLEATAEMLLEGGAVLPDVPAEASPTLAVAFAKDAEALRSLVKEHGAPAGPTPDS
jgi:hypothetical protein